MPGKTRRDVIFDRILDGNPPIVLTLGKKFQLSKDDRYQFALAVILGLLKRISCRNREEAKALEESLSRLEQWFAVNLRLHGYSSASEMVEVTLSKLSVPQLRRRWIEPDSIELSEQASSLLTALPPKKEATERETFVKKHGMDSGDANEADGSLVELILSRKYGISESRVHKILASASKFLR